jgi:hypothetical protein
MAKDRRRGGSSKTQAGGFTGMRLQRINGRREDRSTFSRPPRGAAISRAVAPLFPVRLRRRRIHRRDNGQPARRTLRDVGVIACRIRAIVPVSRRRSLLGVYGRLPLDDYGRGGVGRVSWSPPPGRPPPKAAADKDTCSENWLSMEPLPEHELSVEPLPEHGLSMEPVMECAIRHDHRMPMEARLSRTAHPRLPDSCRAEEKCRCH